MGIFNWGSPKKVTTLVLQEEKEKLSQKLEGGISQVKKQEIEDKIKAINTQIATIGVPTLRAEMQGIKEELHKTPTYRLQAEIQALESTKLGLKNAGLDTKNIQSQIKSKQKTLEKELKNNKSQQFIQKLQSDLRSLTYLIDNNLRAVANISNWDSELRKATNKQAQKLASQGRTITPRTRSESTPPPPPQAPTLSTDITSPPPPPRQELPVNLLADINNIRNIGITLKANDAKLDSSSNHRPPSTPKPRSSEKNDPSPGRGG